MRADKQSSIETIRAAMLTNLATDHRLPTQKQVAKENGLHINTVHQNWQEALPAIHEMTKPFYDKVPEIMRALINNVLETGNPQAARLCFQLMGWSEKTIQQQQYSVPPIVIDILHPKEGRNWQDNDQTVYIQENEIDPDNLE